MTTEIKNILGSNEELSFAANLSEEHAYLAIEKLTTMVNGQVVERPRKVLLKPDIPGIYFGELPHVYEEHYVGVPIGFEGNVIVVGGNGSGKSTCVAQQTLARWNCPCCVTDIKGEHSACYKMLYEQNLVSRPFIIWDPEESSSPAYDPFWWLLNDSSKNLSSNIDEMVQAMIPDVGSRENPFWHLAERDILASAILFYFKKGLSFSQTISQILICSLKELCKNLEQCDDFEIKLRIGKTKDLSNDTFHSLERGLRSKLRLFASDPFISHAFRGEREGAKCFSWNDLEEHCIFLKIPPHRIDQWSIAINLMYTQMIRYLERRPEKYSCSGKQKLPVLLLLDEFARFGRLNVLTSAMATLRSKQVNFCLFVQSVAQLDKIYGVENRRIIFDNCSYRAILRATDPETQKYLAEMVGTQLELQFGTSKSYDVYLDEMGMSLQKSLKREFIVQPHELSFLEDIILMTPTGYIRVDKHRLDIKQFKEDREKRHNKMNGSISGSKDKAGAVSDGKPIKTTNRRASPFGMITNDGAKVASIDKRYQESCRILQGSTEISSEKTGSSAFSKTEIDRNDYVGKLLFETFPEFQPLKVGKGIEMERKFLPIENFLQALAAQKEVVRQLVELAGCSNLFTEKTSNDKK